MCPDDARLDPAERWDRRWSERRIQEPAAFVESTSRFLPKEGRAIDVAGGAGRHALWLAEQGLEVTLADVSQVALDRARELARERGLEIEVVRRDLESKGLPAGSWRVILIHHFLDRDVLGSAPGALEPRGVLIFCQPTVRNLERHERPDRRYLLEEGELAVLVAEMRLEVLLLEEGWGAEGRHEARLVARRPAAQGRAITRVSAGSARGARSRRA